MKAKLTSLKNLEANPTAPEISEKRYVKHRRRESRYGKLFRDRSGLPPPLPTTATRELGVAPARRSIIEMINVILAHFSYVLELVLDLGNIHFHANSLVGSHSMSGERGMKVARRSLHLIHDGFPFLRKR